MEGRMKAAKAALSTLQPPVDGAAYAVVDDSKPTFSDKVYFIFFVYLY